MYIHIYIYIYFYYVIYVCVYIYIYVHAHTCLSLYIYIYMHAHTHVYIYIYIMTNNNNSSAVPYDVYWAVTFIPIPLPEKKFHKLPAVLICSTKLFCKLSWAWAWVWMSRPIYLAHLRKAKGFGLSATCPTCVAAQHAPARWRRRDDRGSVAVRSAQARAYMTTGHSVKT